MPAFCTTYGSVPFLQIVDVYVLPTLIWNASSGTFACNADTSVNSLYVDPAPAVSAVFSGLEVTLRSFGFTPYRRLTPNASTWPVFGWMMSVTATDLRLAHVSNGIARCTEFWILGSSVV